MSLRGRRHGGAPRVLVLSTTCGPDDQFSSPKQCRWSVTLGKLLVVQNNTVSGYFGIRNADLSYFSKVLKSYIITIDADANYIYWSNGNQIVQINPTTYATVAQTSSYSGLRMIDFSGDPLYGYATRNATDHHEVVKIRKSDMTVVATVGGAAGSGDGSFNNPLGLKYWNGYVYVCDYTNGRVVKLNASGANLTWDSVVLTLADVLDLDTDGTYWYIQRGIYLRRFTFDFASFISVDSNGYSLTIIPDQGDGYGQTIAVCSNTNSNLKRHRCDTLALINTVGSSGTGADSLFDLTLTTSVATTVDFIFDDGYSQKTALGTSHALLKDGFAGYTFRNAGPHKVTIRVAGGLGLVTALDCNTDNVTQMKNYNRLSNCISQQAYSNSGLVFDLSQLNKNSTIAYFYLCPLVTGSIDNPPTTLQYLQLYSDPLITGSIQNLPASLLAFYIHSCPLITAGSIAHILGARDIRVHNNGWNAASVDTVLLSISDAIHADAAHFTYATPSLQIGGTNAAPGGTASAATTSPLITPGTGNSDSDWLWDAAAGKHKALTGMAAIYVMRSNTGHVWSVSATGVGGAEMLANPGFETWTSDTDVGSWSESAIVGSVTKESVEKMDGNYAVKLISGGGDWTNTRVFQAPTVVAGSSYRLQFWTRGDGTNAGEYTVRDGSNAVYIRTHITTGITGTTYTLVTYDFVAPAGCTIVNLYLSAPPTNLSYCYFDNASLRLIGGA